MSYIIPEKDLIFYKDKEGGIYSGGFSVKSIMMREGLSPIITMNHHVDSEDTQGEKKVSDFFNDLVIPNWALAYTMQNVARTNDNNDINNFIDNEENDNDVISDDLYNELLELVMIDEKTLKGGKKRTKRNKLKISGKKTRKQKY